MDDPIVELLQENARLTAEEISTRLKLDVGVIEKRIAALENNGVILGYHAVTDSEKVNDTRVTALIEIKLHPERKGGFDRLALRIANFDQVQSCYLMSGSYDIAVMVEGENLREVARFVSEKLSTIEGVLATSTHFQLKIYKQSGFLAKTSVPDERPKIS